MNITGAEMLRGENELYEWGDRRKRYIGFIDVEPMKWDNGCDRGERTGRTHSTVTKPP